MAIFNIRFNDYLSDKFERFRRRFHMNDMTLNKSEFARFLIEKGLSDVELNLVDINTHPDIRLILNKMDGQQQLNMKEIRFLFNYLCRNTQKFQSLGTSSIGIRPELLFGLLEFFLECAKYYNSDIENKHYYRSKLCQGDSGTYDTAINISKHIGELKETHEKRIKDSIEWYLRALFVFFRDEKCLEANVLNKLLGDNLKLEITNFVRFCEGFFYDNPYCGIASVNHICPIKSDAERMHYENSSFTVWAACSRHTMSASITYKNIEIGINNYYTFLNIKNVLIYGGEIGGFFKCNFTNRYGSGLFSIGLSQGEAKLMLECLLEVEKINGDYFDFYKKIYGEV